MAKRYTVNLTGIEANAVLFAVDAMCETNSRGKVVKSLPELGLTATQRVRDQLFNKHKHPITISDKIRGGR